MTSTLLLLSYNNYYNRVVKSDLTVDDYIENRKYKVIQNVNFNPNDDVMTEQIINWNEDFKPDYCLILDPNGVILQRWFIIESIRTRQGQYKISLRRDVISDYYDKVITSPCFIEKGYVGTANPLIFNNEPFICNQIKKNETLLVDKTKCSWIVVYYNLSKKSELVGNNIAITSEIYETLDRPIAEVFNDYLVNGYNKPIRLGYAITAGTRGVNGAYLFNDNSDLIQSGENETIWGSYFYRSYNKNYKTISSIGALAQEILKTNANNIKRKINEMFQPTLTFDEFMSFNGKLYKDSTNNYYRIKIEPVTNFSEVKQVNDDSFRTMISDCFRVRSEWSISTAVQTVRNGLLTTVEYTKYKFTIKRVTNTELATFNYDFSNIVSISDVPYGIIAMPYKSYNDKFLFMRTAYDGGQGGDDYTVDSRVPLLIARDLAKAGIGVNQKIYDIQILPYCPIDKLHSIETDTYVSLQYGDDLEGTEYVLVTDSFTNDICFAVIPTSSQFTKNITYVKEAASNVIDFKTNTQCDFYRLCSPNFNGIFEFNLEKNYGVSYFNVDCTYKPYQPYIHVNPDFKSLYGQDFNDPRGLVCGGDFSITVVSDAWEQYKLQNKNFQEIFNRQIEHMDVSNSIARTQASWSVAAGAIGAGAMGALSGSKLGGPVGAAAGAVVGTGLSVAAGIADINLLKKQQQENKNYVTDIHSFNVQNIQALPDSLSKIDAFNNNNKIFPVLEYYSCTDKEKELFKQKIKYDGMTINAIGTIQDYLGPTQTFIKGQLIRLDDLGEDNHMAQIIYEEISKGVYI